MSAHPGNTYAEKWTRENTIRAIEYIRTFAEQDDCLYIGMALSQAGYYNDLWAYWRRKWRTDREITAMMKRILQVFEARLFERTANGKIPVRVGMFALSHHYGWGREPRCTTGRQDLSMAGVEQEEELHEDMDPDMADMDELYDGELYDGEDPGDGPSVHAQLQEEIQRIRAERAAPRPGDWLSPTQRSYYSERINQYNIQHPGALITRLMAWSPGPSASPRAIPFDGGHFVEL